MTETEIEKLIADINVKLISIYDLIKNKADAFNKGIIFSKLREAAWWVENGLNCGIENLEEEELDEND